MEDQRKFTLDIGITLVASAINMFLAFAISVMLGRYLGTEDLGLYRMVSTVFAIAILIAALGIPSALIKYVAEYKDNKKEFNKIASSGVLTSLLLGAIALPVTYLLSGPLADLFHMPGLADLFRILAVVFPFALVNQALLGMLNGLREMKWYAVYYIIQGVFMGAATGLLIYMGWGVTGAVLGLVLSYAVSCIFLIFVSSRYFRLTLDGFSKTTSMLLSFSAPILVTNGINMVNYQADTVLIGYFRSASEVGFYSASITLTRLLWVIPQAIQMITYPATSEYFSKNRSEALQRMIDKMMKYTACVLSLSGLAFAFFASDIVHLIYGSEFGGSVLPMQVLLVGTVIWGVVISIGGSITGAGRPDLGMKLVAISALTNLVLNLVLIPAVGIVGAAAATSTSLIVATIAGLYLTVKILNVAIDYLWYARMAVLILLSALAYLLLGPLYSRMLPILLLIAYALILAIYFLNEDDRSYFLGLLRNIRSLFK